jgi:hypothetical protein
MDYLEMTTKILISKSLNYNNSMSTLKKPNNDDISIYTLQFTDEATAHSLKDQDNTYINIKYIKNDK